MTNDFQVEIQDTAHSDLKVVRIEGELDEVNIDTLKATLEPLLNDVAIKKVILDFSELKFINSKGIGYLVSMHTHLTKDSRVLSMVGATEAVMDVITLVGLTTIIPYFNTIEEAMTSN